MISSRWSWDPDSAVSARILLEGIRPGELADPYLCSPLPGQQMTHTQGEQTSTKLSMQVNYFTTVMKNAAKVGFLQGWRWR